ncbi:hypothetical protein M1N22_03430 [Dehalococcoidia bacterium]|nr:hypothetical protein [Dehalococcoidia bacterium]
MESKNKIEERIRLFRIVRDIPYYISTGTEQDYSCATKPFILDIFLRSRGLEVKHVLCTFKWEKLGLPEELLAIPHDPEETHEYLLVFVLENNRWVKVDPTWDSRIQHPSIPITEWDGLNDTSIAVPVERAWSPEESEKLIEEEENMPEEERAEYLKRNGEFFKAFNRWLESQRKPI